MGSNLSTVSGFEILSSRSRRLERSEQLQYSPLGTIRKRQQRRTRRAPAIPALIHHKFHARDAKLRNNQLGRTQQISLQLPGCIQLSAPRNFIKLRTLFRQRARQSEDGAL